MASKESKQIEAPRELEPDRLKTSHEQSPLSTNIRKHHLLLLFVIERPRHRRSKEENIMVINSPQTSFLVEKNSPVAKLFGKNFHFEGEEADKDEAGGKAKAEDGAEARGGTLGTTGASGAAAKAAKGGGRGTGGKAAGRGNASVNRAASAKRKKVGEEEEDAAGHKEEDKEDEDDRWPGWRKYQEEGWDGEESDIGAEYR